MNARVDDASALTESTIESFFIERTMDDVRRENPKKFAGIEDLDPKTRDNILRIGRLQLIHHPTKHFKQARLFLHLAVLNRLAPEGHLIAIYGESHSGKSHILNQLRQHKMLQPKDTPEGRERPLVLFKARAPCTLRQLGLDILTELKRNPGDKSGRPAVNPKSYRNAAEVWAEVRPMLMAHGVRILIIDEVHSILTGDGKKQFEDTAAAIKSMLVDSHWPITVIIAGTTIKTKILIEKTAELGTRIKIVQIEPISEDRLDHVEKLILAIENKLELPETWDLADRDRDLPLCFLRATSGHRGRIAKLIFDAAGLAYLGEFPSITRELLGKALSHRTGVADEANAFLMENAAMAPVIPDEAWEKDDEDVSSLWGKR